MALASADDDYDQPWSVARRLDRPRASSGGHRRRQHCVHLSDMLREIATQYGLKPRGGRRIVRMCCGVSTRTLTSLVHVAVRDAMTSATTDEPTTA